MIGGIEKIVQKAAILYFIKKFRNSTFTKKKLSFYMLSTAKCFYCVFIIIIFYDFEFRLYISLTRCVLIYFDRFIN